MFVGTENVRKGKKEKNRVALSTLCRVKRVTSFHPSMTNKQNLSDNPFHRASNQFRDIYRKDNRKIRPLKRLKIHIFDNTVPQRVESLFKLSTK